MRPGWLLLLLLGALGGCAPGEPDATTTEVFDSAGVRISVHQGADLPIPLRVSERFQLGGAADGPESFYQLYRRHVSIGPQGRIAVLNRARYEVPVFDAEGAHLFTLGREGQGPGELARPSSVIVRPAGEVAVYDYEKRALVRFSGPDSILGQEAMSVPFNGYLGMVSTAGGTVLLSQTMPRGDGDVERRVLQLSSAGPVQLGPTVVTSAASVFYESCGMRLTLPPLFADEVMWASNGRRTAIASGPEYAIDLFDGAEHTTTLRRSLAPEVVDAEVVARELGDGERWGASGQECVVPPDEVVEARGHADVLAVVQDLAVAPDGGVWVRRRGTAGDSAIDYFDAEGVYLGTAPAEGNPFPVAFLPDGGVVTIERDHLDVDRLVVYDVELR